MKASNYNCFSYKQKTYLSVNGVEPIHEKVHDGTKRTFWIYERNVSLDTLLNNWTNKSNL